MRDTAVASQDLAESRVDNCSHVADIDSIPRRPLTRWDTSASMVSRPTVLKRNAVGSDHRQADEKPSLLLGTSPNMDELRVAIRRAARTSATVLVIGETGTGKELVAREIHERSVRRSAPFVAVNCAAIPEALAESELFGHERGAFTGASQQRGGRIRAAHGGTLFLDEIEDLSPALQAGLLRFLATGEIQRVGSDGTTRVDARVIVASNRDLERLVASGVFRSDLFYRLDVLRIPITPLRRRREDIPVLVKHFLRTVAAEFDVPPIEVPSELLEHWAGLRWAGNVRELENQIRRCFALSDDPTTWGTLSSVCAFPDAEGPAANDLDPSAGIAQLLVEHGGNLASVARVLGVSRQAVWKRVRRAELARGYAHAPVAKVPPLDLPHPRRIAHV